MTSATQLPDRHAVCWPRGQRTVSQQPLAPRLDSLDGKTVAFLWDYLFRGDEFFPMIEAELHKRYKDVRIVSYQEFGSTHGDDERAILDNLPARLKELKVDALISGIGC
ncbi:MAG: hypothetical protein AB7E83_06940 [Ramlibacter sp.]